MRILFITANRIGDAVLTTGVLRWLEKEYPTATFSVVCGPVAQDLFRGIPRLERLIPLPKRKWNGHWIWLWQECISTRWDLIVDLRNSIVSRLLLANRRAYRPPHNTGRHRVVDNAAALKLDPPPSPYIWIDKFAEESAARLMPQTDKPVLALGPSANWPAKQWPVEKFLELAQRLMAKNGLFAGSPVLIAAAPHERKQVEPLLKCLPNVINVIGQDLLTVAACLKHCELFVGNDSGLTHVAAAVGVPTLALFGPGYEKIYAPWGHHTAYVRTPESAEELLVKLPRSPNLMESLSVEMVMQAIMEKFSTCLPSQKPRTISSDRSTDHG